MNNLQNNQKSDVAPMGYDALLGAVKPIPKDNGSITFWGKHEGLKDNEWHHVAIVVENGVRTNYIDGVKV